MNSVEIYPKILADFIIKYPYIPKKIKFKDDFKLYAKYFSLEEGKDGFKIEDIIELEDNIYFQIKFLESGRQALIPYEESFHYYELMTDKKDIVNIANIINTEEYYFGSEIKYWFFTHNINFNHKKYKEFLDLIVESHKTISDRKVYKLMAEYNSKERYYTNCYVSLQPKN